MKLLKSAVILSALTLSSSFMLAQRGHGGRLGLGQLGSSRNVGLGSTMDSSMNSSIHRGNSGLDLGMDSQSTAGANAQTPDLGNATKKTKHAADASEQKVDNKGTEVSEAVKSTAKGTAETGEQTSAAATTAAQTQSKSEMKAVKSPKPSADVNASSDTQASADVKKSQRSSEAAANSNSSTKKHGLDRAELRADHNANAEAHLDANQKRQASVKASSSSQTTANASKK